LTPDDIKYSTQDAIIGPRFIKGNEKTKGEVASVSNEGINVYVEKEGKRIPIKLEENQFFELDADGRILKSRSEGWLTIVNPSPSDKIWNVAIETPKYKVQSYVGEIEAGQQWKQDIELQGANNDLPLQITEVISRNDYAKKADAQSELFLDKAGINYLYVSIFVTNRSGSTLKDFDLLKKLPSTTEALVKAEAGIGSCEADKFNIRWHVKSIRPFESIALKFQVKISPVPTVFGEISAGFLFSEAEEASIIEKFKASVKAAQFIEVSEQDDSPNTWDCSLKMINRSLFLMNITSCQLLQEGADEECTVAEDATCTVLEPFEETVILKAVLQSETRPALKGIVDYMPEFIFDSTKLCSINISAKRLEILDIYSKKSFDVEEINSYAESDMNCTLEIQNHSSIGINHLFFDEQLSEYFGVESIGDINLEIMGNNMRLQEWQDQGNSSTQELNSIQTEVKSIESKFNSVVQNPADVGKINLATVSEQAESVGKSLEDSIADLETRKNIVKDLEAKVAEANSQLDEQNRLAEQVSHLSGELDNLKHEAKEQADLLENIEEQRTEIEAQIIDQEPPAESEKADVNGQIDETGDAGDGTKDEVDPAEKQVEETESITVESGEEINERLSLLITQQSEARAKIDALEQSIEAKRLELEEILTIIPGGNDGSQKDGIVAIERQIKNANTMLADAKDKYHEIASKVESLKKEHEKLVFLIDNADLISRREALLVRKEKIEMRRKLDQNFQKIRECWLSDFQQEALDPAKKEFDAICVRDDMNNNHLLVAIVNLGSLMAAVSPEEIATLSYKIHANRPRHDGEYKFPSTMYYMTDAAQGMQSYTISKDMLPKLHIIHERYKMMVGKLIDKQSNDSKYFVTLLVKNSGSKPITDVKIVEILPKDIEILNACNKYEEAATDDGMKQVTWFLDQVNAFQESEIGYVVDLHGLDYDLNNSQLCFI
jgi:ribosomal protein L24/predicted  nucleic acid-binding Zn-ribbon protein